MLTVPLSPTEPYVSMAWSRWVDTLVAVVVAAGCVHLIGARNR